MMTFLKIPIIYTPTESLHGFPVLIKPSEIKGWGSITKEDAKSTRWYKDEEKRTELPREVVSKDEIHVLCDLPQSEIYVEYDGLAPDYGKSDDYGQHNVWGSEYEGVWHDGGMSDSTSKENNASNSTTTTSGGNFTTAIQLSKGSPIKISNDGSFDLYKPGTGDYKVSLSAWAKNPNKDDRIVIAQVCESGSSSAQVYLYAKIDRVSFGLYRNNGSDHKLVVGNTTGDALSSSDFFHYYCTYDGSTNDSGMKVFLNGEEIINRSTSNKGNLGDLIENSYPLWIGESFPNSRFSAPSSQTQTEFKFARAERTPEWIKTEYNNQHDPKNFFGTVDQVSSNELSKLFSLNIIRGVEKITL